MDTIDHKHYREQGYLVVRNIVPLNYIHDLYQTVARVLHKHVPTLTDFTQSTPWSNPEFDKAMLEFREQYPQKFGLLFDTVQTSTSLWRLGTEQKICDIAAALMEEDTRGLSVTDLLFRMDPPADTRNRLQWHQDSSYFRQNDHGAHGCVCSMPMIDLVEGHGPLEILPGSHRLGRIEVASSGQYSTITSEQFRIADSIT